MLEGCGYVYCLMMRLLFLFVFLNFSNMRDSVTLFLVLVVVLLTVLSIHTSCCRGYGRVCNCWLFFGDFLLFHWGF